MNLTAGVATSILLMAWSMGAVQETEDSKWEKQMLAGKAAMDALKYAEAEQIYASIVAQHDKSGTTDALLGLALGQLGVARMTLARPAEAAELILRSVAILEACPEPYQGGLAIMLLELGSSFYYQHLYTKAERAYERALDLGVTAPSTDPRVVIELLSNLGSVYQIEGRYGEARALLERALDLLNRTTKAGPLLRAQALNSVGTLERAEGRHAEAERAFREAVHVLGAAQDVDGALTATLLDNFALECMRRKQYNEAAMALSEAVAKIEVGTFLPRTNVAQILQHYRECLQKGGNRKEVRRLDSRMKLILSLMPRQPADGLTVDAREFGRGR